MQNEANYASSVRATDATVQLRFIRMSVFSRVCFLPGQTVAHKLLAGRGAWLQVVRGSVVFNDKPLKAGDGVAIDAPGLLGIEGKHSVEVLLFDLAM